MDPLTHMVTGALVAQSVAPEEHRFAFALIGAGAGVVPDIDFLAKKARDHLLFLKLHRGFTHSLLASPIIGACAAASGSLLFGTPFWRLFAVALVASWSHVLLDLVMHAPGLRWLWPLKRKVSAHLVVGLNPLTSSARCGERSLTVCLRCTMHSAVLSPLVVLLWVGFLLSVGSPAWVLVSRLALGTALAYLVLCQVMRTRARVVLRAHLAAGGRGDEVAGAEFSPASFRPWRWIGVTSHASGHRVWSVNLLAGGRVHVGVERGLSDDDERVRATRETPTVREFLENALLPHATLYPVGDRTLVVWRDLAFAFSPTVSLFAVRVELDADQRVTAQEFRERWDPSPEQSAALSQGGEG